jgi:hypothetical protein
VRIARISRGRFSRDVPLGSWGASVGAASPGRQRHDLEPINQSKRELSQAGPAMLRLQLRFQRLTLAEPRTHALDLGEKFTPQTRWPALEIECRRAQLGICRGEIRPSPPLQFGARFGKNLLGGNGLYNT